MGGIALQHCFATFYWSWQQNYAAKLFKPILWANLKTNPKQGIKSKA
jgi:hypothetical protein